MNPFSSDAIARLDKLSFVVDSLVEKQTVFQNRISENETAIQEIANDLASQHSTYQQTYAILVDAVDSLVTQINQMKTTSNIPKLSQSLDFITHPNLVGNDHLQLKESINQLQQQFSSLSTSISKNALNISKLNNVVEQNHQLSNGIEDLLQWKTSHETQMSNVISTLSKIQENTPSNNEQFNDNHSIEDIALLKLRIGVIEDRIDELETAQQQSVNQLNLIQTKITTNEEICNSNKATLQTNTTTISNLTNKVESTNEEIENLENEIETINTTISNFTTTLTEMSNNFNLKYDVIDQSINSTKEVFNKKSNEIDCIKKDIKHVELQFNNQMKDNKVRFNEMEECIGESQMNYSELTGMDATILKQVYIFELDRVFYLGIYYNTFQHWTNKMMPRVIFTSTDIKSLELRLLNNAICGKKNLMFILVTKKNNIFGCYTSSLIPNSPLRAAKSRTDCLTVSDDPNHFIFTLKNPSNLPPRTFQLQQQHGCSIGVYSTKSLEHIFTCYNFFTLKRACCKMEDASKFYRDINTTKFCEESKSQVDSFSVIEWI
ncbi:hypothetical protein QTN25_006534 [Entamoeba marina]